MEKEIGKKRRNDQEGKKILREIKTKRKQNRNNTIWSTFDDLLVVCGIFFFSDAMGLNASKQKG